MAFLRRFVEQDHDLVLDTSATPVDNIYSTFASVVAAANARNGYTRIKVTQDVTVSSGAYNLSRVIFVADPIASPTITFDTTATMTGTPPLELVNVAIESDTAGPLWTMTASGHSLTLRGNAQIGATTAALIELDGNDFNLFFHDQASFGNVPTGLGVINNADDAIESSVVFINNSSAALVADAIAASDAGGISLKYFQNSTSDNVDAPEVTFSTVNLFVYRPHDLTTTAASLGSNQNDYEPSGSGHADVLRLTSSTSVDITGLVHLPTVGYYNPVKTIVNVGSNTITLKHQSESSTAEYRFICPGGADLALAANEAAIAIYDATTTRWRIFSLQGSAGGGGGGGTITDGANVGGGEGIFAQANGTDLEFKSLVEGYGIDLSSDADEVTVAENFTVTTLVDGATIAVDTNLGPNYMLTIAGDRTLSNPTNAAAGKRLVILVSQDGTGGRTLTLDTDYVIIGNKFQIAQAANAVSVLFAHARDFGGGLKWYVEIHHAETKYVVSPSWSADTHDYAPAAGVDVIRATTDAAHDLTGIVAVTAGAGAQRKRIINVGSNNLVIKHQSTSSTAANRFICPGASDLTLFPDDSVEIEYDDTTARWRIV